MQTNQTVLSFTATAPPEGNTSCSREKLPHLRGACTETFPATSCRSVAHERSRVIVCAVARDETDSGWVNRTPSGFRGITGYVGLHLQGSFLTPDAPLYFSPTHYIGEARRNNTNTGCLCSSVLDYARVSYSCPTIAPSIVM